MHNADTQCTVRGREGAKGQRRFFLCLNFSCLGSSLAVRWLRLHALTAKGPGSVPGQGTKISQEARRSK